jgi:outer membrane cobalamin receptor
VSAAWFLRGDRSSGTSTGWTKLRAGAGLGIKPPTVFELGFTDNPSLKPERSRSFDIGVEHAFAGMPLVADATVFFNRYDHLIVGIGAGLRQASGFSADNVGNARAAGVETGVRFRNAQGDSLHVSYTFLNTRMLSVENVANGAPAPYVVGDWLIRRPRHSVAIDARTTRGPATVFISINQRSRTLDIEPNLGSPTMFANGFSVVGVGAGYRINSQLEAYARVTNLFNNDYEEVLGYPALGRSAMVGVRVALSR